ncbi:MAG: ABC transporter permease [Chloroflexi bacterium]|nr:ABC transporter permease [Chloroflexota bacterium]
MMFTPILENVRIALNQLLGNKLRTMLTMLGIIIGITSVVLLLSLGQAVQSSITSQFEGLGASLIRLSLTGNSSTKPLTQSLADALADDSRAPAIAYAMPTTSGSYAVVYNAVEDNISVTGATTEYLDVNDRSISSGRMFTLAELEDSARVAIIGVDTAENLFESANPIGQQIRVRQVFFQVIGVLDDTGGENDDLIVVPLTTSQTRLNASRSLTGDPVINMIQIKAVDNEQVEAAIEQATRVIREERSIASSADDDFRLFTATTIIDSLSTTIETLTVFLGVLAGISLVVGGIGVMNIMLVTVNERTREIGLRKAVGAQRGDIVFQFLTEAVVMALFGGLLGILLAVGGSLLITALVESLPVVVQASSIALAVGISVSVGVFFGVYPASRAASLNPIDALRYE